jgi:hypothetical protein
MNLKDKKSAYNGNKNLKRVDTAIEWTPELIVEYRKCALDPNYFIETYVKIVNVDKGLVNFNMYPYQKDIVELSERERFVICKMPRQCGKTTTIVGIMLHRVLFNETYSVAILANKERQAIEILSRIQFAYEHLPKWLQQGIKEWNKKDVELENGSKILASSTSSSAIRGTSQNLVYLDEFAFVPNNMQEDFFASVYPTISSGKTTKVLITSTPNGLNQFHKIWVDSEEGRNSYKRIDVHWSDMPGRDEAWKQETIRNTSEDQFRVEFECEFVGSSDTLIHATKLRKLVYRNPVRSTKELKIYAEPDVIDPDSENPTKRLYTIIVDTSRGVGGDFSAFSVIDITELPYQQVATYKNNNITPLLYPNIIFETARYYNNAFVLIETNDIGQQVADTLQYDLEYENVLRTAPNQQGVIELSAGFHSGAKSGVRTTKSVKRIGCLNVKSLIESDKLIVNDYDTIQEMTRFVAKGQSYEAEEGTHDDLMMGLVLFGWMSNQPFFKELTNNDIRKNLYMENMRRIEDEMLPFPVIDDNNEIQYSETIVDLENMSFDRWMST